MYEKYANNLPSQNSEGITGDSNADIDGEKVPDKVKSRLCCSIDFQNLQRWKKLINNNSPIVTLLQGLVYFLINARK